MKKHNISNISYCDKEQKEYQLSKEQLILNDRIMSMLKSRFEMSYLCNRFMFEKPKEDKNGTENT